MPSRPTPIVTGQTYHVFNRSVGGLPIYKTGKDYQRFINIIDYYRHTETRVRYSFYNRAAQEIKVSIQDQLTRTPLVVSILAFAIMPTHYHFVLRQEEDMGISMVMRGVQEGYAKYFNIKYKRFGSLYQALFKSIRIESEEQLLHIVRYVHLNPITGYILKKPEELSGYPWVSYGLYEKNREHAFLETATVLSHFKSIDSFREFTFDQVDYQKTLAYERHLYHDSDV